MKRNEISVDLTNKVEYLKKYNPNIPIDIIVIVREGSDPNSLSEIPGFHLTNIVERINMVAGSIAAKDFDLLIINPNIEEVELDAEVKTQSL